MAVVLMSAVMAIGLPLTAEAQIGSACYCPTNRSVSRNYRTRSYRTRGYVARRYATRGYTYRRPSFYRRHRNLINIGIGTGAGALIGGLLRGRKGAGYGALIGAGSGALYTYVLRPKKRRY
jgi:hypothetical protein